MRDFDPVESFRAKPLVEKCTMSFGAADRLEPFSAQYQFFTPALLYLYGHFNDVHLGDFLKEVNREVPIMFKIFERRIFHGMNDGNGDPGWNFALWAVNRADWPALESFILSVAICDNRCDRVYRTGAQDLRITDPLWQDNNPVASVFPAAPQLSIVSFGVDCNVGCVGLNACHYPPAVGRFPPQERTKQYAKLVLSEQPDLAQRQFEDPLPTLPTTPVELKLRSIDDYPVAKQQEINDLIRRYRQEFGQ